MLRVFIKWARLFVALASLGIVCGVGAFFWGLYQRTNIELITQELVLPNWQGQEFRIVVLADIHALKHDAEYLDRIVQEALALKPNAIVMPGDFMNGHTKGEGMECAELAHHLQPLSESGIPLYAVLGNHDYWYGANEVRRMLQRLGVKSLEGRCVSLELGQGRQIHFAGMRCLYIFEGQPGRVHPHPQCSERDSAQDPLIFVGHTPASGHYAPQGAVLTIAGHSHGGQVCWPNGVPIKNVDRDTPKELAAGFAYVDRKDGSKSLVYTSRGLGTSILPIRLFCRPEMTLIILKGQD